MSIYTLYSEVRMLWVQCDTVWAVITVTAYSKFPKNIKNDNFVSFSSLKCSFMHLKMIIMVLASGLLHYVHIGMPWGLH